MLNSKDQKIRICSLNALMDFIKIQARLMTESNGSFAFPAEFYRRIISGCIGCNDERASEDILQALVIFYLGKYHDLAFYFFKSIPHLVKQLNNTSDVGDGKESVGEKRKKSSSEPRRQQRMERLYQLMISIEKLPEQIDDGKFFCTVDRNTGSKNPLFYPKGHRKAFSEAWLSFMKMDLTPQLYRDLLSVLHVQIIPNMSDPRLLHDFLTDSYNQGGAASMLALNGLFTLIHKHNL
jgi:U3 small nucleolar RNA-associated protein 19